MCVLENAKQRKRESREGEKVGKLMSGSRVSDLHLKRELTQIRKAGRVLRDPGTTSSWRSPLNSSRSLAAAVVDPPPSRISSQSGKLPIRGESSSNRGKEKKVFLYNWKTQRSSSDKSGLAKNSKEDGEGDEEDGDGRV